MKKLITARLLKPVTLALLWLSLALPALAVESTTVTYYHNDLVGSPVAATDELGALKWRQSYAPYGSTLEQEDGDNTVGYTGHRIDKDIGLTYAGARFYDHELGRFTGLDPVGSLSAESNPMMFNRYAYANNNPYKYVDPDGRFAIKMQTRNRMVLTKDTPVYKKKLDKWASKFPGMSGAKTSKKLLDYGSDLSSTSQLGGKSGEDYWESIATIDKHLEDFFKTKAGSKYPGFTGKYGRKQWSAESFKEAMVEFGGYLQKIDRDNRGPTITMFKELYGSPWETENERTGLLYRERQRSRN